MRRLILVRHAHAGQAAATDRSRALSPRGRAEAAALGRGVDGAWGPVNVDRDPVIRAFDPSVPGH